MSELERKCWLYSDSKYLTKVPLLQQVWASRSEWSALYSTGTGNWWCSCMETSHICGGWWTLSLDVTGGNVTFDPDTLSTAICQNSHRGIGKFARVISCSADSMVTWLEKQSEISGKGHSGHLFARKSNYLFLYSCGHGIGKLNKQLLRCRFPGDLPKMKLHIQWSCIICAVVKANGGLTSCKTSGETIALRHSQRITNDYI